MRHIAFVFMGVCLMLSQSLNAQTHPLCLSVLSDSDGDGWGWEFDRTCVVHETSSNVALCVDSDGDGYGWNGTETCLIESTAPVTQQSDSTECVDPDGDGYGWNGTETCLLESTAPVTQQSDSTECVDTDGDGFGWNGTETCLVESTAPVTSPSTGSECIDADGDGFGWNGTETCVIESAPPFTPPSVLADVTDVVLMMGQSNALGEDTNVDPANLDAIDENIIAWTQFDGWQVADLCSQIWQKGWFPWRGGVCSNHPAFQIAKGIIAADPSRKVAIIPTGVAGKPISWWDDGAVAYELASDQVTKALAALPGHTEVDLVAWSQGEANHGAEDVWYDKLTDLIARMRAEAWMDPQETVFIAQETKDSSVNERLPSLDSDNDALTAWIPASDLTTKDGVHWSAPALRTLGDRYAATYLSLAN